MEIYLTSLSETFEFGIVSSKIGDFFKSSENVELELAVFSLFSNIFSSGWFFEKSWNRKSKR